MGASLERLGKALLTISQRVFYPLSFSDIDGSADQVGQSSVLILDSAGSHVTPDNGAVFLYMTQLVVTGMGCSTLHQFPVLHRDRPIIRMDQIQPGIGIGGEFVRRIAKESFQVRIPVVLTC